MHTLHLTASPVHGLQHLPGGGRLYVTPSLTKQQQEQLVQALKQLYIQDQQDASSSHALQPQNAKRAVKGTAAEEPPSKRANNGQQQALGRSAQQQQQAPKQARGSPTQVYEVLTVVARHQMGEELFFKIKRDTKLEHIKPKVAERWGVEVDAVVLHWDGNRLKPDDTAADIGLEDGDTIDVFLPQTGC
jgi:small ubiquitin-related modifier